MHLFNWDTFEVRVCAFFVSFVFGLIVEVLNNMCKVKWPYCFWKEKKYVFFYVDFVSVSFFFSEANILFLVN